MHRILPLTFLLATPAVAEVPQVATDIAPVHSLVAQVMGELGAPALVVDPAGTPHAYSMRPSEARAIASADLVVWIGPDLTPWLQGPIDTLAPGAQQLALIDADGTTRYPYRDSVLFGGGEGQDHDHDHDHGGSDPHAWLAPDNAALWLDRIADSLAALDPDNATTYRANAAAGQARIADTVATLSADLAPVQDLDYVVFHDAYQYFERAFGLSPLGAIALTDAEEPSAARLTEIRAAILDVGATCALAEPQFNTALLETAMDGTAARIGIIDPLGSTIPQGADHYPTLLLHMGAAIAACADQG